MLNPFKRRVPLILQSEAPECGIACVAMIAGYHGFRTDLSEMRMRLSPSMNGVTLEHLAALATTMKMSMRGVQAPLQGLGRLRLPAILHWDMNHFVVLTRVEANRIVVHDPARGKRVLALPEASRHYTGVAAELLPSVGFAPRDERERITAWQLMGSLGGLQGTIAQVILLSLVLEVFAIASPFFVQIVVDRVVVGRDEDLLTLLGLGFALLVLMQVATTAVRGWLGVYLSTTLSMRLLDALFGQLLRLPLVMLWYSPLLAAIVLLAAVLYGVTRWVFYGPQRRALDEQLVHEGRSATHFIETLRGMMAIKLNLREAARRAAYQNLVVEQVNAGVAVQNMSIVHRAANGLIFGLENIGVIWLGTVLVMDGRFSVGMLFGFLSFKLLFLTRGNNLVDKAIDLRMLDLHAERIADIALSEPESAQPAGAQAPDAPLQIRARALGFAYGVEGFAFRNIEFSVRPGETVAIVGPSGSGKTTLVKVLVGLLDRTEGLVEANGRDLRDWDRSAYRGRLGVVMQDDQLFVGTLEDNISFFDPQYHPNLVRAAASIAGIDDEILAMPMQYNTIVGSLGMALSGGQKQRVLLARALYRKPHIVFLDEAFDQLDLAREREITDRLKTLGIGMVIVSHRPETVRNVDRIVHVGQMPQVLLSAA